jgi:hypothetical protein
VADRLALPREDAEEVELDVRVRIDEALDEPRRGAADGEPQLLVQLAVERRAGRLARFELAAGELPVARVGLARGALRQQHLPVGPQDDRGRDANDARAHPAPGLRFSAAAPAWFFANCQAMRPLREPRCSANCSASRVRVSASRGDAGAPMPNVPSQPATAAR